MGRIWDFSPDAAHYRKERNCGAKEVVSAEMEEHQRVDRRAVRGNARVVMQHTKVTTVAQVIEHLVDWRLPTAEGDMDLRFDPRQWANMQAQVRPEPLGAGRPELAVRKRAPPTEGTIDVWAQLCQQFYAEQEAEKAA